MIASATTIIDVFRDPTPDDIPDDAATTYDAWGNEIETPRDAGDPALADDPYLKGVFASIIEESRRIPDPTTGDLRLVRYLVGKVSGGTPIEAGDIVQDRADGVRYAVRSISQKKSPVMLTDRHLELELTT